jgi:flagellum-specific ATP synthase
MTSLVTPAQFEQTRRFKQLYSRFQRNRELITVGAYQAGTDTVLDEAIAAQPHLEGFLQQNMASRENYANSVNKLGELFR